MTCITEISELSTVMVEEKWPENKNQWKTPKPYKFNFGLSFTSAKLLIINENNVQIKTYQC
jgi:hypothetical protein